MDTASINSENNVFDLLFERGFIEGVSHDDELRTRFGNEQITFYIGYDPTANSLHVGHLLTLVAAHHMQQAGHRPIILMGGGTGMVGDATDRDEMRRIMSVEEIDSNIMALKKQASRFINFEEGGALLLNNADWLRPLNYLDFMRSYGVHFNVNRMISAESYKARLNSGLTFFEFNYMVMQAYDFLHLHREHGCVLQCGGSEQWSNILAGVDLIRRLESAASYALTFRLLLTSDGRKMGKTQSGALWLDAEKTSPYDFFQYFRNIDDSDVGNCLRLLTFLSMEEIRNLEALTGNEINRAKEILAHNVTKTVHGDAAADKALEAAHNMFGGGQDGQNIPTTEISHEILKNGIGVLTLMVEAGLAISNSEARRVVEQGGLRINGLSVGLFDNVGLEALQNGKMIIQKGKKTFHRIILSDSDGGV